jgi:hypothetical protein
MYRRLFWAAAAACVLASVAQAEFIDDFTSGAITIAPSGTFTDSFFSKYQTGLTTGSLTGFRQLSGYSPDATGLVVQVDPSGLGSILFSTSATASPAAEVMIWFTQYLSPFNLAASGATAMAIDVLEADFGQADSFTFNFIVQSGQNPQGGVAVPVTLPSSATPYTVVLPFSAWQYQGVPLDFTQVTRIAFGNDQYGLLALPSGTRVVFGAFRTVPEPSTAVLLIAAGGLMIIRWRSRSSHSRQ